MRKQFNTVNDFTPLGWTTYALVRSLTRPRARLVRVDRAGDRDHTGAAGAPGPPSRAEIVRDRWQLALAEWIGLVREVLTLLSCTRFESSFSKLGS